MDISIVSVNWNSYDFARILIESIQSYTSCNYEIIIVDNSTKKEKLEYPNVKVLHQTKNVGHGMGLNIGIQESKAKYTFFLDIDCHILNYKWVEFFLEEIKEYDVIGGKGVPQKPIRPACMLVDTQIGRKYDYRDTPGYKGHRVTPEGFDVAISAYNQMLKDDLKIKLIESKNNHYGTLNGEEWCIQGTPLIYHHWHGSHLKERQVDFKDNLIHDKQKLFSLLPWRTL